MTDLVLVHGIGAQGSSRLDYLDIWQAALAKGLSNVRSRTIHPDLEFVFYGHLYNDGKAGDGPSLQISDISPGFEQDFAIAMAESLSEGSEAGLEKDVPGNVQWAVRLLERHRVMDGVQSRLIRYIKQVNRYLTDAAFKREVWAEMSAAMATRPRAVVAHSLGTVIAYDWLRSHPSTSATSLITLGSPLGFRGIRKHLHPGLDQSPAPWPHGVTSWLNVAARKDPVALVKTLDGLFAGPVDDELADNRSGAAHDAVGYLQNLHTARAVAKVLD